MIGVGGASSPQIIDYDFDHEPSEASEINLASPSGYNSTEFIDSFNMDSYSPDSNDNDDNFHLVLEQNEFKK